MTAPKQFTGRHATMILVGFFGIVIAVNVYMATQAVRTFGGTVVDNSYVASQKYNEWLAEARQESELGWTHDIAVNDNRQVVVTVDTPKGPLGDAAITGAAEHPLGRQPSVPLRFERSDAGQWHSVTALPIGRWRLRLEVKQGQDQIRILQDVT